MLLFLAASGHNNLLVLYQEKMEKPGQTHPAIYIKFTEGVVLRCSDNYWIGISSDLYIEQVLMIILKSVGVLTRGRDF